MGLMGRKGDVITCTNGHPLYQLTRDIRSGETMSSKDAKGIPPTPDPNEYETLKPCHVCEAYWWKTRQRGGALVFIDGEWRGDGKFAPDNPESLQ
jgi:hypothetical protein